MSALATFLHAIGLGHTDTDSDDDEPMMGRVTVRNAVHAEKSEQSDSSECSENSQSFEGSEATEHAESPETSDRSTRDLPDDPTLPGCIFDSVIRLFNRTMPEFVTRCIDTDSQRQYLYHAIESDVRRQIERIAMRARVYGASMAATLPADPSATADDARRRTRQLLADSERRRRACEDRIADLEAMLAKAATREAALAEENARLNSRLRRSRLKPDQADGQLSLF